MEMNHLRFDSILKSQQQQQQQALLQPTTMGLSPRINAFKTEMHPDQLKLLCRPLVEESGLVPTSVNRPRSSRKPKQRSKMRYMTQPITLIEIQETEEDLNAPSNGDLLAKSQK